MKRLHGVVLLFAGAAVFGLIANTQFARDVAVIAAGYLAAVAVALAATGALCFLAQCGRRPAQPRIKCFPGNVARPIRRSRIVLAPREPITAHNEEQP